MDILKFILKSDIIEYLINVPKVKFLQKSIYIRQIYSSSIESVHFICDFLKVDILGSNQNFRLSVSLKYRLSFLASFVALKVYQQFRLTTSKI